MNFPERIAYCRKKQGLSQEALAEKLGVSRQAVSKWETGDAAPEMNKILLLADAFGVSTDWLLRDELPTPETRPNSRREEAAPSIWHSMCNLLQLQSDDKTAKRLRIFVQILGIALAGVLFYQIGYVLGKFWSHFTHSRM